MKLKELSLFPMNLQLFAEGGDGGDGGGEPGGSGGEQGGDGGTGGEGSQGDGGQKGKPQTFDSFLKEGENQKEFDKRIQEAVNTAVTAAQEKWQILADDRVSEAEKLAKMTDGEKAQYLQQKREKELADREAAVTRKELIADAKNTLAEKKLPVGLAEVLNYADKDTCSKSIEAVEKAFQEMVEAAVNERLKGDKPPRKPGDEDETLEKQIEAAMGLR